MSNRLAAETRGRRSEALAAWALRLKGYRILGRRLKTPLGEIDMVALPPFGPVGFVEVQARSGHDAALLSVGQSQRTRILVKLCVASMCKEPVAARRRRASPHIPVRPARRQ